MWLQYQKNWATYNHAYHRIIKLKPVDAKSKTYINLNKENNYKDPKFKVSIYVKIAKYKKTSLQKVRLETSPRKFLLLKKLKILCRGQN